MGGEGGWGWGGRRGDAGTTVRRGDGGLVVRCGEGGRDVGDGGGVGERWGGVGPSPPVTLTLAQFQKRSVIIEPGHSVPEYRNCCGVPGRSQPSLLAT